MADKHDKFPENAPGAFYVDTQCIDCDVCRDMGPEYFMRNDGAEHSYVHRQPEGQDAVDRCVEALEACPVEAIGRDGV